MAYQCIDFFTDPVLRAPTLGSMLMCAAASLVGVIVFIRRKSLVGEALSHAAYPGLVLSAVILSCFFQVFEENFFFLLLLGSFASCLLGLAFLKLMQSRFLVKSDAALCFVLSSFFGVGVLFASRLQFSHPLWYRQIQMFLYGQTATLEDIHVWMYGFFFAFVLGFITVFYRLIEMVYFDSDFARSLGVAVRRLDALFFFLLALAVVVAMKSVGVVLLSGMFIAPALTARRLTHKLSYMLGIACIIGALSAFLGNYFSVKISDWVPDTRIILPTGPMIVLTGSFFSFLALIFSLGTGGIWQKVYKKRWEKRHLEENFLRSLALIPDAMTKKQALSSLGKPWFKAALFLKRGVDQGWIEKGNGEAYRLSIAGRQQAEKIEELYRIQGLYWLKGRVEGREKKGKSE